MWSSILCVRACMHVCMNVCVHAGIGQGRATEGYGCQPPARIPAPAGAGKWLTVVVRMDGSPPTGHTDPRSVLRPNICWDNTNHQRTVSRIIYLTMMIWSDLMDGEFCSSLQIFILKGFVHLNSYAEQTSLFPVIWLDGKMYFYKTTYTVLMSHCCLCNIDAQVAAKIKQTPTWRT